jgi:hypothetical protein
VRYRSIASLCFLFLAMPQLSHAATPEEACKRMTGKLAASAKWHYWNLATNDGWDRHIREGNLLEKADFVVSTAYNTTEKFMNQKWPGFWAWSQAEVITAWR